MTEICALKSFLQKYIMKKNLKSSLLAIIISFVLNSCSFFKEEPIVPQVDNGEIIFWTKSETLGGAWIDVQVGNVSAGRITIFETVSPECSNRSGHAYFSGKPGNYSWTGKGQDGSTWSGKVVLGSGLCTTMELN